MPNDIRPNLLGRIIVRTNEPFRPNDGQAKENYNSESFIEIYMWPIA